MAALNHESLATSYGLELWRRTPVLVVEYFPGGTLASRLEAGPLPMGAAVALGLSLTRALAYMHDRGVLHRDLKPSNIAFTATGAPKLLDFGLATLIEPAVNVPRAPHGPLAGTPAYLPPEAYRGALPDRAFDLWALAIVLWQAMTGHDALPSRDHAAVISAAEPGRRPAMFFDRALAADPTHRFQTALDMHAALEALGRS